MPGCAVFSCNNQTGGFFPNKSVTFHSFPRHTGVRKEWIHQCRRTDSFNVERSKVCSLHFKDADYQRDLQSELLGQPLRKKRKLLETAVPSVNLGDDQTQELKRLERTSSRESRREARNVRKRVLDQISSEVTYE